MPGGLNEPIIVRTSRLKTLRRLAPLSVVVILVSAGALLDGDRSHLWKAFAASILLVAAALLWVLGTLFPVQLVIGPQGLSWGQAGRARARLAWRDVAEFKPLHDRVGYDYAADYRREERDGRLYDRANRGVEAVLPRDLTVDPAQLASMLNEARRRWAA